MGVLVRMFVLMIMTMITLMIMMVTRLGQARFMGALLIAFPGGTIILGHDGQARHRYHPRCRICTYRTLSRHIAFT
jgi:hypothetical protein